MTGNPPPPERLAPAAGETGTSVTFAMLLNLAAVANSEDPAVLWGFLRRYAPGVSPETHPRLDHLVGYAVRYFRDFVRPAKTYRAPDAVEREALRGPRRGARRPCRRTPARRISRRRFTMWRGPSRATRISRPRAPRRSGRASRTNGSTRSTRCCSARSGARASALSRPFMVCRETRALIRKALDGGLMAEHAALTEERASRRA